MFCSDYLCLKFWDNERSEALSQLFKNLIILVPDDTYGSFVFQRFALPNIYCEKNFSGSCPMCWNVTQGKAKQSKAWPKAFLSTSVWKLAREIFLTFSLPFPFPPENSDFF